ncbi:MAG: hypothetical protein LBP76_13490 [Treponema sp.]|nr:hypothetical protein [Treponema sp.]
MPDFSPVYLEIRVEESFSDRLVRDLLASDEVVQAAGIEKPEESVISESNQWVFFDDFGNIKRIPLDQYGEGLEPFDPRNDGYADKLRSFFVHDGLRRFFFPFTPDFSGFAFKNLKKALASSLKDIPFSLVFLGKQETVFWYLLIFAGSLFLTLALSGHPLLYAALIPALLPFALMRGRGFAPCACLLTFSALLHEPLGEFFTGMRYNKDLSRPGVAADRLGVFKTYWILALVFLVLYWFLIIWNSIGIAAGGAVFFCFTLIFLNCLKTRSLRGKSRGHVRFTPVFILSRHPLKPDIFLRFLLPSMLGLGFLLWFPPLRDLINPIDGEAETEAGTLLERLYPDDYRAHALYQRFFSYLPLGTDVEIFKGNGVSSSYLRYYTGSDGLISGAYRDDTETWGTAALWGNFGGIEGQNTAFPPFPLAPLMDFFTEFKHTTDERTRGEAGPESVRRRAGRTVRPRQETIGREWRDYVPFSLLLLASVPFLCTAVLALGKKGRKMFISNDKRVAA